MVEYTVVLIALMAALLAPKLWPSSDQSSDGLIGLDQSQRGTLLRGIAAKHRGYGYALSLGDIPEVDGSSSKLIELADYYDSLGKYPELSKQLRAGGSKIAQLNGQLTSLNQLVSQYVPPNPPSPCQVLGSLPGPSIGGFSFSPPGCSP